MIATKLNVDKLYILDNKNQTCWNLIETNLFISVNKSYPVL